MGYMPRSCHGSPSFWTDSNPEGAETTPSELRRLVAELLSLLLGALGHVQDGLGSALGADVADAVAGADGRDTLGDGIEWCVLLGNPVSRENFPGLGVPAEGEDRHLIDGSRFLTL